MHLDRYGLPPAMQKLVLSTRDQVEDEIALVRDGQLSVEKINVFTADRKLRAMLWERLEGFEGLAVTSSLEYNLELMQLQPQRGMVCSAWQSTWALNRNRPWHLGTAATTFP